ncbi:Imm52 family immunity protein [Xanthomonas translucens]|uniref:Imm52 family immunity protein n=1 Tax=Xanthomonas campestris pv. translucens TaxID=343 RepID=UPI0019D58F17|nr:Imm52 family immunity protein [Xanthomonas translucens]QSQ38949.1 immunity 52 family protein [Xanthomonas translucens pv. translucens]
MIRAAIDATLQEQVIDTDAGYERLLTIGRALAEIDPTLNQWYSLPETKNGKAVSLFDRSAFIANYAAMSAGGADPAEGFSCMVTTADTDSAWQRPGCALLKFDPRNGYVTFEVQKPVDAYGEKATTSLFRSALRAIAQIEELVFGATDINARRQSGKGLEMYMGEHQLFPHRRWLGWMGFVPHMVEPRHIPEAAELIPVGRKGTVIVAVDECFDLHNPAHLKRAHEVEARMAHLGLLEVTDTSLLG